MDAHRMDNSENQPEMQLFEAVFQFATMGILITDQTGKVIMANHFALREFGYEASELIGKRVEQLIPQRFHSGHVKYREGYNAHAETRAMGAGRDLFGLRKDGSEFPVEVSLSPFKVGDDLLVIAFIIDITVRKEKEKAEKEYESALISLTKERELNDMKSRFVSMASHEFKTPLSTILTSAYLMSKYTRGEDQPQRDKHIERIKSSVSHLNNILNEFLAFGRIESGSIQVNSTRFDLEELIHEVCSELGDADGKHGEADISFTGDKDVFTDKYLLRNILTNLISNAFKFSPGGQPVEVSARITSKEICLSVKDHGVGISLEDRQYIYNLFYRGSNVLHVPGTGLGLSIVNRYVELLHADLTFTSELNKGTEFILKLKNEADITHRG